MLKYWQHTIGLFCLCQRHTICMPHVLARSISAKHLDSTLHLQDHHRRNTKVSSVAGHEHRQERTSFPLGSDRRVTAVRAVVSLCIRRCPARTGHETERRWLTGEKITLQTAIPWAPLLSQATGGVRQCSIHTSLEHRGPSAGRCQVLLVLISPGARLSWHLPAISLKVLTAILVALRKAPGEVTMC